MLSKKYRFHSRGGVNYTYKKGRPVFSSKELTIIYNENPKKFLRFAVVVPKKVQKLAVNRNKIRRRLYEAIRLEIKENPFFPKSGDFIFLIRSDSLMKTDFSYLRALVSSMIK
ncbi:ribonuclease P protein component [Candidatus Saccharibacteria bacterium]|nr:ribonuclease P protein component [Candidatus Saccharibacteria bacterium]